MKCSIEQTEYDTRACPGTFGVFSGQDFVEHHQSSDIDYATFHLWPGNWNRDNLSFMRCVSKRPGPHLTDARCVPRTHRLHPPAPGNGSVRT